MDAQRYADGDSLERSDLTMRKVLFFWFVVVLAAAAESPFVGVFIDSRTESKLGPFPYDRAVLARTVEALHKLRARGVVVKFFLDSPKSAEGDRKLGASMKKVPVLLQAGLFGAKAPSNPLPARFYFSLKGKPGPTLSGQEADLPLPLFADNAHGVGFVDVADMAQPQLVPAFVKYRKGTVKSLWVEALELATGSPAVIEPAARVRVGPRSLPLDQNNQLKVVVGKEPVVVHSLLDLLEGRVTRPQIEGKVVVLGYDGEKMEKMATPAGSMRAHRWVLISLIAVWEASKP